MIVHGIPGPYRLEERRHHLDRRRRHARRLGRRRGADVPRRGGRQGRQNVCSRQPSSRCTRASHSAAPATASAIVSHAIQRVAEEAGLSVVRSLVGHGVGRSMHEDPQVPNYGKPGKGPLLRGGHGARDRADDHRRAARRASRRATAGRSTHRTARRPRTSSSPSRSPADGPLILTPWHLAPDARAEALAGAQLPEDVATAR